MTIRHPCVALAGCDAGVCVSVNNLALGIEELNAVVFVAEDVAIPGYDEQAIGRQDRSSRDWDLCPANHAIINFPACQFNGEWVGIK